MWQCPRCSRSFHATNQSHYCVNTTIDDIFEGKAENVVHAFDDLLLTVMDWQPQEVAAAKKAVVFTSKRAWLIVKPMSKLLDVSFYTDHHMQSPLLIKSATYMKSGTKYRNSFRLGGSGEITPGRYNNAASRIESTLKLKSIMLYNWFCYSIRRNSHQMVTCINLLQS